MLEINNLPIVTASLNAVTILLLGIGFSFIRMQNRTAHKVCMLSAVAVSAAFLIVYLIYHFNTGLLRFGGEGAIRPFYSSILTAHVIGAMALVPLVPWTLFLALKERLARHKRLARWTLPLWLCVAVSGVVVYLMAFILYSGTNV